MTVPALLKVLIVFSTVLTAHRFRVPLGVSLAFGGLLLDFWSSGSFTHMGGDTLEAVLHPELWLLLIDISFIAVLGHFLSSSTVSATLLGAARRFGGRHGTAFSLILVPATIGMVPMPGGALFSAPLVKQNIVNYSLPQHWKVAVNYWFRHILEYWWPLYPVVIVTLSIFPIPPWQFIAMQIPFTLLSVASGYIFLLKPYAALLSQPRDHQDAPQQPGSLALALLPIGLVLAATVLLPASFSRLFPALTPAIQRLLAMFCGLAAALSLPYVRRHCGPLSLLQLFTSSRHVNMLGTLAGVMFFHHMLDGSGLMRTAALEMAGYKAAVILVTAILPFVAGYVTGIAIGFAGIAFPLVAGLITSQQSSVGLFSGLVLAFSFGYSGMMLSPVHLCLILTKEYFKASYFASIKLLVPLVTVILTGGILLHALFLLLGM